MHIVPTLDELLLQWNYKLEPVIFIERMSLKETVRLVLIGFFLIFVFLPLPFGFTAYVTGPDPSIEQWSNLFESAVVPWWIGIATTSPVLLVILFLVVSWAGAEEIL